MGVSLRGLGRAQSRVQRGLVFTEEIQLPACVQLQGAGVVNVARERGRIKAGGRETLAGSVQLPVDLGQRDRMGTVDGGLGAPQAVLRQLQVRVVVQGGGDQAVQLGIAQIAPPLRGNNQAILWSIRWPFRYTRDLQAQRGRIAQRGLRGRDATHVGAGSEAQAEYQGAQAEGGQGRDGAKSVFYHGVLSVTASAGEAVRGSARGSAGALVCAFASMRWRYPLRVCHSSVEKP